MTTVGVMTAAVGLTNAAPASAGVGNGAALRDVVVIGSDPDVVASAVTWAGGQVLARLPVIDGVAARLPQDASLPSGFVVAPQRTLRLTAETSARTGAPVATIRQTLGLPDGGTEGTGVTVAVLDTGIADVPDLAGRITDRVDLTGSGRGDGYGHGTFMAGLIAGSGTRSGGAYRGIAPAANLIDVKVADAQGNTDLITVLRGLQWVSERADGIRVLNLSLSSGSTLPYQLDPLNQALRSLWNRGMTVVVPSGNDGPGAGSITSPGNDPLLLTVGGLDEHGTVARTDDSVAPWSGRGPTIQADAKPDVVAPGASVVSLRSPGSMIDKANPQAHVDATYMRGSGTSMATAVASGVAALVLAGRPQLKPAGVKQLFMNTAYQASGLSRADGGAGGLDAARVLAAAVHWRPAANGRDAAAEPAALGRDAADWSALQDAVLAGNGARATAAWNRISPASREWAARAWAALDPATRSWAARAWAARAWAGADEEWAARAWAARAWAARAWAASDWSARAWADADWSARAWADADWSARAWATAQWSARAWAWLPPS